MNNYAVNNYHSLIPMSQRDNFNGKVKVGVKVQPNLSDEKAIKTYAILMKRVAGRQTRYVNKVEKRSGTLWEGRYKSSPISTNDYLLACCRYVELNPVRAGMVAQPEDYRWSSYSAKVGLAEQGIMDYDPLYLELSKREKDRQQKYREYVHGTIADEETDQIRRAIHRGQLTGTSEFVEAIEAKLGKRVEFRGQGRPRK